jgi:peroxiredoxin
MSLQAQLDQTVEAVRSAVPSDIFGKIGQSISDLKQTGQDARAAGVGAKPELPTLKGLDGSPIDLKALAAKGPLVLTFYRGGWCPYCNVALKAYAGLHSDFAALGASVVAITPELAEKAEATSSTAELPFPIAIDAGNDFARKLGLVFSLPTDLQPLFRQIGIDLQAWNGDESHELPIPATYLIDTTGLIRWAFVEADFTKRADPVEVLAALRRLA